MTDIPAAGFPMGCGDDGHGQPLVLLHCSGADRHLWNRVLDVGSCVQTLIRRRVLRPEFFGCGETAAWPGPRPMTLDDVVRLVERALPPLDQPIDLVGHSMGGAVALHMARIRPGRVRTLTLIEPTAFYLLRDVGAVEDKLFSEITDVARTIMAASEEGTSEAQRRGMACFIDYWNGIGKWHDLPEATRQVMMPMLPVVAGDFSALHAEATRLADLRSLVLPVLIVSGRKSPLPVQHIADLLEDTLPQAERCILHDAGHMIPLSHATQLAGLIASQQLGKLLRDMHACVAAMGV